MMYSQNECSIRIKINEVLKKNPDFGLQKSSGNNRESPIYTTPGFSYN